MTPLTIQCRASDAFPVPAARFLLPSNKSLRGLKQYPLAHGSVSLGVGSRPSLKSRCQVGLWSQVRLGVLLLSSVGSTHLFVVAGLKSPFSFWLSAPVLRS